MIGDARPKTLGRGEGEWFDWDHHHPEPIEGSPDEPLCRRWFGLARPPLAFLLIAACLLPCPALARSQGADTPEEGRGGEADARAASAKKAGAKGAKAWPRIDVGCALRADWSDVQVERGSPAGATEEPEGRFLLGFAALIANLSVAEGVFGRIETRFSPNEPIDLQEAILRVENLPLKGFLQVGLDRRLIKPGRKTQTYPLAGMAFWKGTDAGLRAGLEWGFIETPPGKSRKNTAGEPAPDPETGVAPRGDFRLAATAMASVGNGLPLGSRPIGEDGTCPVIGYEEGDARWNSSLELGLAAGLKGEASDVLRFEGRVFAYASKLTLEDRQFLHDLPGYGAWESRDHWFTGGDIRLRAMGATLFAQFCNGRVGRLGRAAWYGQASYEFRWKGIEFLGARWLRSAEPLVRYGVLDLDMRPDPSEPLTWDRRMLTAALIVEILKEAELHIEYSWNGETTGDGHVRNDEFLVQLRIRV